MQPMSSENHNFWNQITLTEHESRKSFRKAENAPKACKKHSMSPTRPARKTSTSIVLQQSGKRNQDLLKNIAFEPKCSDRAQIVQKSTKCVDISPKPFKLTQPAGNASMLSNTAVLAAWTPWENSCKLEPSLQQGRVKLNSLRSKLGHSAKQ